MINKEELQSFIEMIWWAELTEDEKSELKRLWASENIDKAFNKIKDKITNKVLTEDLSKDFIKWAVFTIWYLRWIIRK